MIYRGTKNGFRGKDFHKNCDYRGATLTIIKTESKDGSAIRISGGYTDIPWISVINDGFIEKIKESRGNSFIFSLRDNNCFEILKFLNNGFEVNHSNSLLCCFGFMDLILESGCNKTYDKAYSKVGC